MTGEKGYDDKNVSHQIHPSREGTQTVRKTQSVQGQNKSGAGKGTEK